jgi:aspartate aminotransferase
MAGISNRAQETQFSPIRKLKPLADEALNQGKLIYNLNIGQPDVPTPEAFLEGLRDVPDVLAYSPSQGIDEAVEAMRGYYEAQDIPLERDQVIITTGGSEAVLFAFMAVADPGDEIIVPEPFYTNYNSYATMAGVELVPIETRAETGYHLPEREVIEGAVTPRTKAMLICNPNNPTGTVYTAEELETLRRIALERDLFLICDEVYREFVYDGLSHRSVLQLEGVEDRAVLVDSISKRFSACGARLGAIASRNRDVMGAALKFAQARLSPPTAEQLGLIRLLASGDYRREVERMIAEFRRRRDVVHEEIERISGAVCLKPHGAFYAMVKLPVDDAERFCAWLLTDFQLEGETVMLAPAADFYKTQGKGRDEARIAYVLDVEKLRRAMGILSAGLEAYGSR